MSLIRAEDIHPLTQRRLTFLITGAYGTGKSVFASTFLDDQPDKRGFVLGFDENLGAYQGKQFDIFTTSLDPKGWQELQNFLPSLGSAIMRDNKYQVVVLDSCTSMQLAAMNKALDINPNRDDGIAPVWKIHYKLVRSLVFPIMQQIKNWGVDVILIAHLEYTKDKHGEVTDIHPKLQGALAQEIPQLCNEIYFSFVDTTDGKPSWRLRTQTKGLMKARSDISSLYGIMPDIVPNHWPTIKNILKKNLEAKIKKP